MADPRTEKTLHILAELKRGNRDAAGDLFSHVYEELRAVAARFFRSRERDSTLQPTALVHEAYLRLVDQTRTEWNDRAHFLAVAAKAMRRILIDHHRRRGAAKRGQGFKKITLSDASAATPPVEVDFLAIHEALEELERLDPRQHELVELRFFGGLSVEEAAEALGLSKTTAEREWRAARAWLMSQLDN